MTLNELRRKAAELADQSQPPPRAECDACGEPATRRSDEGFSLCTHCYTQKPSNVVDDMVAARRRSLQSAQKWEPKVGDAVEWDESQNPWAAGPSNRFKMLSGRFEAEYGGTDEAGVVVLLDGGYDGMPPTWVVPLRLIRPAASAQPESWHGFAKGERVEHCLLAGVTMTVVGGSSLFVKCWREDNGSEEDCAPGNLTRVSAEPAASNPAPQPRRDPYVCHRESMASILSGSAYELGGQLERSIAFQTAKKDAARVLTRAERLRAQHLANLDRPIRTGALGNRCRYGSLLSNHGWDSSDVDDELGGS